MMTNLSSPSIPAAKKKSSITGGDGLDDRRIMVQVSAMATDIYLLQNVQDSDLMVTGLFPPTKAGSDHSRSSSDGIKNDCSCTSNPVYTFLQCTRKTSLYALTYSLHGAESFLRS